MSRSVVCTIVLLIAVGVNAGSTTFTVGLATKTSASPTFGFAGGISTVYTINGQQNPSLTLSQGTTYTFDTTNVNSLHPVYITTSPSGGFAGLSAALPLGTPSAGISTTCSTTNTNYTTSAFLGCNLRFTPSAAQVGQTFYYQCSNHLYMGFKLVIAQQTICEFYAAALTGGNQSALLDIVFNQVILDLAGNPTVGPFFDGSEPCCPTDFRVAANFALLRRKLASFFGPALGCNDGSYPTYASIGGNPNMQVVHRFIPIGPLEFFAFNARVNQTLLALGVSAQDVSAINGVLESFKPAICNQFGCRVSICDRYSDALRINNTALVSTVVDAAIPALTGAGTPTRPYFDGTFPPGSVNFLAGGAPLTALRTKLIDFFFGGLGCTDELTPGSGVPARTYTGKNMSEAHKFMCVSQVAFDFFVSGLGGILLGANVTATDVNVVASVLRSFAPDIVNKGCVAPPATGGSPIVLPTPTGQQGYCGTTTYNINVASKQAGDSQFGVGFPAGFTLNGNRAPAITLYAGCQYTFASTALCIHPFYFFTGNAVGASTAVEVSDGISSLDYTLVCGGSNQITFTVTPAHVGRPQLYYGCRVHANMGWQVNIQAAPVPTGTGTTTAPSGTITTTGPTPTAPASIATVAFLVVVAAVLALLS